MEQMSFVMCVLAAYGLGLILVEADGPFGLIYKLRHIKYLGALSCMMCVSVWLGALGALVVAHSIPELILFTFAISGGAIAIDRIVAA